jgi:hypothetical protein
LERRPPEAGDVLPAEQTQSAPAKRRVAWHCWATKQATKDETQKYGLQISSWRKTFTKGRIVSFRISWIEMLRLKLDATTKRDTLLLAPPSRARAAIYQNAAK